MPRFAALVLLLPCLCPGAPQEPAVTAEQLRRAQQLARPAEPHQRLQRLAGDWQVEWRTTAPGAAAAVHRGTLQAKPILGGRHLVLNFRLQLGEQPFEAVQILGYDTLRSQFTSSWRDELSTWAVDCAGAARPGAEDRLELHGVLQDARDPTGRPFRLDLDLGAKDRVEVVLHDTLGGRLQPVQQQVWTRAR